MPVFRSLHRHDLRVALRGRSSARELLHLLKARLNRPWQHAVAETVEHDLEGFSMTAAVLFPGQGSERPGMGRELFGLFPDLVARADAILGYPLKRLCGEDPDDLLHHTRFAQPAIYVVNALAYRKLGHDEGMCPDALIGHSVGEYNALEAAGAFDFGTGLRLIVHRALLMDRVPGAMSAISGVSAGQVAELLTGAVEIAAINSPRHTTLAGPHEDLQVVEDALRCAGAEVTRLRGSGPFHSRAMSSAAAAFATWLNRHRHALRAPRFPVYANVHGRPHTGARIVGDLVAQIDHPVQWVRCIRQVLSDHPGVTFRQVGPGTSLELLSRRIRLPYQ